MKELKSNGSEPPPVRIRAPKVQIDPYLGFLSESLPKEVRGTLAQRAREIEVKYAAWADEIDSAEKSVITRAEALADLASYEANLNYLDALLKNPEHQDDDLLKLAKEILWREHLYGLMVLNNARVLEICKVDNPKLKYVIVISDQPLAKACQWRNSMWEEGLTWLPIPARKTRLSLGILAPSAEGVPICTVIASSSIARRRIATGEDVRPNPEMSTASKYAITEFESLTLRKDQQLLKTSLEFSKSVAEDNRRLGVRMFQYWKSGERKTGAVPAYVELSTLAGKIKAMVRSKWFWVALGLGAFILAIIGQRAGWWDIWGIRAIAGIHTGASVPTVK